MRPRFRASTVVYAARYAPTADALGSMQPGYAAARHALRGTLLPSQDGADPTAAGLRRQEELVLLLPLGADIAWQDGIYLSTDAARPDYRVAALERYPLHLRARLERVAGHGGLTGSRRIARRCASVCQMRLPLRERRLLSRRAGRFPWATAATAGICGTALRRNRAFRAIAAGCR